MVMTSVHESSFFQVELLLREWVRLYHQPAPGKESEKAFSTFVAMVGCVYKSCIVMRSCQFIVKKCLYNKLSRVILKNE